MMRALALGKDSATLTELGTEERRGEAGGSAGFCVCCCASVLWIVANFRCRRSTCAGSPGAVSHRQHSTRSRARQDPC